MRGPLSVPRRLGALLMLALLAAQGEPPSEDPLPEDLPQPRLLGPRSGEARGKALRRFGGNVSTEKAVEAGLDWLARHRAEDGLWDADGFPAHCEEGKAPCEGLGKGQHGEEVPCPFDGAISALAVLAFLGHGHLPGAAGDPHGELLEEALPKLAEGGAGDVWELPLALMALAEAEAMERRGRFAAAARALADTLLSMRQPDGAWGYAAPYREGSDVPYTALAVQALVAARDVGCELPADLAAGVDRFLASLECSEGQLAYLKDGREYGYTPTAANGHLAAAIRELLQVDVAGARHRAHLALVGRKKPAWKIRFEEVNVPGRGKITAQVGSLSMYQWWYGTIASFHHGGAAWSAWFKSAKSALVDHQRTDGCARGSFDPVGTYERQTGGRVFATALGVLILEQPYSQQRQE
ncbi:MAG: hypothetical protein HY812_14875 [Planctomycetes bacterium]|nr:hypothetical protein [Planctomycetota bacterium]